FNYETEKKIDSGKLPEVGDLDYSLLSRQISPVELEALADNILINDFAAIKLFTDEIEAKEGLADFITLIRFYADNFNDQQLEEILEEIRKRQNG
ncbi:MAG: hypothetical protein JEY91_12350, partial [Spirochaetaceae bacterium]|nr:hypothetical protein [Spirochaetaceae bacterium]